MRRFAPGTEPGPARTLRRFVSARSLASIALILTLSLAAVGLTDRQRVDAAGPSSVDPLLQLLVEASVPPSPSATTPAGPSARRGGGAVPVPASDVGLLQILEQTIAVDTSGTEPVAGVLIETTASDSELRGTPSATATDTTTSATPSTRASKRQLTDRSTPHAPTSRWVPEPGRQTPVRPGSARPAPNRRRR